MEYMYNLILLICFKSNGTSCTKILQLQFRRNLDFVGLYICQNQIVIIFHTFISSCSGFKCPAVEDVLQVLFWVHVKFSSLEIRIDAKEMRPTATKLVWKPANDYDYVYDDDSYAK